jgi:hypothetical protein
MVHSERSWTKEKSKKPFSPAQNEPDEASNLSSNTTKKTGFEVTLSAMSSTVAYR